MGKVKRECPDCLQTITSSSGVCFCGGSIAPKSSTSKPLKRRRTERVKRDKPNFYDALELEKQAKKDKRKRHGKDRAVEKTRRDPSPPPPPHRMQLSVKKMPDEPEVKEEELEEIVLSEEKIAKFSLILDDINRKICASSWKGYL